MSWTGRDLRTQLRRSAARGLETLASLIDVPASTTSWAEPAPVVAPSPSPSPPPPAPKAEPKPVPGPKAAPASGPLPPLPSLAKAPAPSAKRAPPPAPEPKAATAETPAAAKAKESPEDRQRKHWERTRVGLLRFVHESGGRTSLRDLHNHSEKTYFVAHVGFSRMMEELTDQGLVAYDHDTAEASITDAGRAELD